MRNWILAVFLFVLPPLAIAQSASPTVRIVTSMGEIVVTLNAEAAPRTVENFLQYVDAGFYSGTLFHRVIDDFMIQGGGFDTSYQPKPTQAPIRNEADNGLTNARGTIAMARTSAPHSATAQFYINLKDNDFLDHSAPTPRGWGYAVFGVVVEGMDVVDAIGRVSTGPAGPFPQDAPRQPIIIETVERVEAAEEN